ncbi:MAG TPA: chemotaxis protein CheW [Gemmatimonadales bacterium]|nr:chemotaxis protein CheW [Gemmatimonadales bacterium]
MIDEELLQFVSFRLGGQEFAVDILQLRRVLPYEAPTPIDGAPPFVAGALPFEGAMLPVLDVRARLGLPSTVTADSRLLVLEHGDRPVMLVVDAAREVVRVDGGQIVAAPAVDGLTPGQVVGLIDRPGRSLVILNPTRLLAPAERAALDALLVTP